MTIFKSSLLVLLTLLVVGCATTSSEIKPIIVETTQKKDYQESDPLKHFSGIEAVSLNRSKIILTSVDKSLYEEYSVPLITYLHEYHSESHLIDGFFITAVMLPLCVAISPVILFVGDKEKCIKLYRDNSWKNIFGYSEKKIGSPLVDSANKIKTGKTQWRETEKAHKFLVSGFNKDYIFDIYMGSYERLPLNNQALINLSEAILNTDFTKTTTIKITCLDCDLLGEEEQALYKDAKKTVEITSDFRAIKADLIVEAEKKKVAQVKHDKEAAIQSVVQAKEDLQRKKEAQGVPLNEFKAQCQALGFKLGSTEYGNCVLELNDAK